MDKTGHTIFVVSSDSSLNAYIDQARAAIICSGYSPVSYSNVRCDARSSNLDRSLRADLYKADAVVILLSNDESGSRLQDNWALPEVPSILNCGMRCLIVATSTVTATQVQGLSLSEKVVVIHAKDPAHLKKELTSKL